MKVNGQELFNYKKVNDYTEKFEAKIQEIETRIDQLNTELQKLDAEIEVLFEDDILENTADTKLNLSNAQARRANLKSQLDIEIQKALKIKEIMSRGLAEIIPEASKQIQQDIGICYNIIEREFYRQLQEVRQKQEELLLTLQVAHNEIQNKLFHFNELCEIFGLKQYKRSASFHQNLYMPHRSFPEYGSPLLNCQMLTAVEDRINRARAEANAVYNNPEKKGQLPPAKTLLDIDLQAFLDRIESTVSENNKEEE